MVPSVATVAHELLLYEIKLNSTTQISLPPRPYFRKQLGGLRSDRDGFVADSR